MFKKIGLGLAILGGASLGVYLRFIRPWQERWGATDEEVRRPMPGDDLVVQPILQGTRAVTIKARPEEIWPWLVQIGQGRGGFYSYTWIEKLLGLDITNTNRILPAFQHLEVGDEIPGLGATVKAIEPNRLLVLAASTSVVEKTGTEGTWVFGLYPLDEEQTRLVTRNCARWPLFTPRGILWLLLLDPGIVVMMRKMLLGIKQRAEKAHEAAGTSSHATR